MTVDQRPYPVVLQGVTALLAAGALQAQTPPDSLLRKAIARLERPLRRRTFPALEWRARAVVHLPGRDIVLHGVWKVQPPDSAVVATFDTTRGPASTQRMVLAGDRGWLQRDSALTAMPADVLTEERHQFYLYSLLQLSPLERPGVKLHSVPPDA